jgi:hypothetical protein
MLKVASLSVGCLLTFTLGLTPVGAVNDAIRGPSTVVALPPFRPSFTWTCIFKEQYPTGAEEYGPLVLEVVKPPVIVRHVEVNEGAAPNTFNIEIERLRSWGMVTLIGTCARD